MMLANSIPHIQHEHKKGDSGSLTENHLSEAEDHHHNHSNEDDGHFDFMYFLAAAHSHQTHEHEINVQQNFKLSENLISVVYLIENATALKLQDSQNTEFPETEYFIPFSGFYLETDFLRGPPTA